MAIVVTFWQESRSFYFC